MGDYLIHWGIPGQKKGNRRYQYEDGTLTPEGRERYRKNFNKEYTKLLKSNKESKRVARAQKASRYIESYSKLSKLNKRINADSKRAEDIGEVGVDYFDSGLKNITLPTASREYRKTVSRLNRNKKLWNTTIKNAGYDKETEDRIQYVMIKTYQELIRIPTFEERFEYLKLKANPSEATFGGHRYLNQALYKSPEWQSIRQRVIIRDNGCDLGLTDRPIRTKILIHHLNPIIP